MIKYGILGAGWRAEFYLRIAALAPETFSAVGICARNPERARYISEKYSVKAVSSVDELLALDCDFIVCCVNKGNMLELASELCERGTPVLMETPMGINAAQQKHFFSRLSPEWKIQVAEQFHLQPMNMAISSLIDSGLLGEITSLYISCCHDYHAASLIRRFLGTGDEIPVTETAVLPDRVNVYNSRSGLISPVMTECEQRLRIFRFKGKTAIYDFESVQYFSDIRSRHITVRGTNGEITGDSCTYLEDGLPFTFRLSRHTLGENGSLDGLGLFRITGNGRELYRSPLPRSRLSDEELAIASCLLSMDEYLRNGREFYSVREAALDAALFFEN